MLFKKRIPIRVVSLLLAVLIIFSNIAVMAFEELYKNFESYSTPFDFETENLSEYLSIQNAVNESFAEVSSDPITNGIHGSVLNLHGTSGGGYVYVMPFYNGGAVETNLLSISFDFYADAAETTGEKLGIKLVTNERNYVNLIHFEDGNVFQSGETTGLSYGNKCWYSVEIQMDWKAGYLQIRMKSEEENEWSEKTVKNAACFSSLSETTKLIQIRIGYNKLPSSGSVDFYIDNYMHTSHNLVGIYAGKSNAIVNCEKINLSKNYGSIPFLKEDILMIPLSFFADSIDAEIETEGDSLQIVRALKRVTDNISTGEMTLNDEVLTTPAPIEVVDGTVYGPLSVLCEVFGLELFQDSSGLAFYSENRTALSWENDKETILKLTENFIYDDISDGEIVEKIKEKTISSGYNHPRLIVTEDKFRSISEEIKKEKNERDRVIDNIYTKVKATADSYLGAEPPSYQLDGVRLLNVAGEVEGRILNLAMMYNITKYIDVETADKYAEAARKNMLAAANFTDWNPYHFLDVATMAGGLAFGYDWLYNWMTEKGYTADMAVVRQALINNGFTPAMNDYNGTTYRTSQYTNDGRARSFLWNSESNVNNWRFVIGGGLGIAALAIVDELEGDCLAMAEKVLSQSLLDIRPAISMFAPEGAYSEGLGYWAYANKYYHYLIGSLQTATGTDFGYADAPGLKKTTEFLLAMNGPVSTFNYHDASRSKKSIPTQTIAWAKYFENYALAVPRINLILKGGGNVQDFLYYDKCFIASEEKKPVSDALFKEVGIFAARSDDTDEALWIGFHADSPIPGAPHAHNDVGSFVLDAMGQNFFLDLGPDDYNLENYSGGIYRTRAEGHNTIVINPSEHKYSDGTNDYYDQRYGAFATIDDCVIKERGSFAKSNLTDVYADDVLSAWRGVKLDNERRTVTVQDEIVMKESSEFYWFAHTDADVQIDETDGRTAFLTKNGRTLVAQIVTKDDSINPKFTEEAAVSFETSPQIEGQNHNAGISKLTIHLSDCEKIDLAVNFSMYDVNNTDTSEFIALDDWNIPDGELPTKKIQATAPTLDGKVVSTTVTGLNPKGCPATLIVALYSGNKLQKVLSKTVTVENVAEEKINIDIAEDMSSYTELKAFVWSDFKTLVPLTEETLQIHLKPIS